MESGHVILHVASKLKNQTLFNERMNNDMMLFMEAGKMSAKFSSMRRVSRDRHTEDDVLYLTTQADKINMLPHDAEDLDGFMLRDIRIPEWFARLIEPSKVCVDPSNQYVCEDFKINGCNPETIVKLKKEKKEIPDVVKAMTKKEMKFNITKFQECLAAVAGTFKTSVNYTTNARDARKIVSIDSVKDCVMIGDTVVHHGAPDFNPVKLSFDLYKVNLVSGDTFELYEDEWFRRLARLAANEDPSK
jgi:hypothetical protein